MRIAIAQLRMHWTLEHNLASMLNALQDAADRGAQLCVFGELSLTGYHRQIAREADPARVQQGVQALQSACAQRGVAAAVGAPTWPAGSSANEVKPLNSHLLIDEHGVLQAQVDKDGLSFVETMFFQPGQGRPIGILQGRRCTSVLCREVEETGLLLLQVQPGTLDLVLWPSLATMPATPRGPDVPCYEPMVQALARHSGAHWVQCNAPIALNTPDATDLGSSVVVAPDGETLLTLPRDEAGVALFELGARRFDWLPEATVPA